MKGRDGIEASDNWATPRWLYEKLDAIFNFDFDPCPLNADFDGLKVEWGFSNYVNPPYSRILKPKFIQRAYEEYKKGKTCVLLIPAATGTKQFHELLLPGAKVGSIDDLESSGKQILFFKGRLSFEGVNSKGEFVSKNKGKHDSMLVILKQTT